MADPADPFTAIEDAAVEAIQTATAGTVKVVDNAPPNWSKDMLKRVMRATPAVFVCVTGAANPAPGAEVLQFSPKVSVIVGTSSAADEQAARRGAGSAIGAYQIVFAIAPALHGLPITDIGELQCTGVAPVDVSDWDMEGLTLYEISFDVTDIQVDKQDPASPHPFEIFHADWKNSGAAGADDPTIAQDIVTIPT